MRRRVGIILFGVAKSKRKLFRAVTRVRVVYANHEFHIVRVRHCTSDPLRTATLHCLSTTTLEPRQLKKKKTRKNKSKHNIIVNSSIFSNQAIKNAENTKPYFSRFRRGSYSTIFIIIENALRRYPTIHVRNAKYYMNRKFPPPRDCLYTWHRIHITALCLDSVCFTHTHVSGLYGVLIIDLIKNNVNDNSTIVIITKRSDAGSGIQKGSSG